MEQICTSWEPHARVSCQQATRSSLWRNEGGCTLNLTARPIIEKHCPLVYLIEALEC